MPSSVSDTKPKHVPFIGYWALVKTENYEDFLRDLGFPWVVRKAASKFGNSATEIIGNVGDRIKVTTINPKGSWTREYEEGKTINQRNAVGEMCKTTSWWEGRVHHTRMEGSAHGVLESWRCVHQGVMVVKSVVKLPKGREACMYWYFEASAIPQRHHVGLNKREVAKQIEHDQLRVEAATRKDNAYLQRLLLDWNRWETPADAFIRVSSPSYSRADGHRQFGAGGSPHQSAASLSKSPSDSALSDVASQPVKPDSRVDIASMAASERAHSGSAAGTLEDEPRRPRSELSSQIAASASAAGASGGTAPNAVTRELSLSQLPAGELAARAAAEASETEAGGSGAPVSAASHVATTGQDSVQSVRSAASGGRVEPAGPSGGSGSATGPPHAPGMVRIRSQHAIEPVPNSPPHPGLASIRTALHGRGPSDGSASASGYASDPSGLPPMPPNYARSLGQVKSASSGSLQGLVAGQRSPLRHLTPSGTPKSRQGGTPPSAAETLLAYKIYEFVDSRGIASVVPLHNATDTHEPELLGMSPEQAEETHAKMREVEELTRQTRAQKFDAPEVNCGCFSLVFHTRNRSDRTVPDYLRSWEMYMG